MRIIAHRGASAEAPENTLAAFERALAAGADMIELDVRLSADGVPVVIHDETLSRTTNGEGRVGDLSLEALKELSAGGWFSADFLEEKIPTLAEVYDLVGQRAEINVEIKGEAARTGPASLGAVPDPGALARTIFSSFNPRAIESVRNQSAPARLALLTGPASVTNPDGGLPEDPEARVLARVARWMPLGLEGANIHCGLASAGLVRKLHAQCLRVYAYTVDGVSEVRKMAGLGVDGVFANDPAPLLAHWPRVPHLDSGGSAA